MAEPEHPEDAAFEQFGQSFGRADEGTDEVGRGRAPRHDRYLPVQPPNEEFSEAALDAAGELDPPNRPPPDRPLTGGGVELTDLERGPSAWEAGLSDEEAPRERDDPKVP